MSKIIVFATPVFLFLIAIECWLGIRRAQAGTGRNTYRLNDTINSISLGMLSQVSGILSKIISVGIYTALFAWIAPGEGMQAFWHSALGLILALLFYDFCYYWNHRLGHEVAIFWASHVVHHQSQQYNLSTALRQTSSGAFLGWIFYVPMALAGVPPEVFAIVAIIDLLYQFWVHTEQVGKLGWFDRVFCSPSNHRVHHAVNAPYLDKNYGGILILWDRLFGTFEEEKEKCVYGTLGLLNSWDPLWANAEVYWKLLQRARATRRWKDKLLVWIKPPGWLPDDLAQSHTTPPFNIAEVKLYDPPLSRAQQWFAALQFGLMLGAVSLFLWFADDMSLLDSALVCTGLAASLWALGRFLQSQLHGLEVLMIQAAACACLSAVGILPWFMLFKPMVMALGIVYILFSARAASTNQRSLSRLSIGLLLGAIAFSLGGDVFLMLPGDYFISGLASFLIAHIFYIALFRQDSPWFANRAALLAALSVGCIMYAILWNHLPDLGLKIAVACYVTVISVMVAQAIGRASQLHHTKAVWVAWAAGIFMLSDTLIAINKFLIPIPLADWWILTTYYAAQILIMHNILKNSDSSALNRSQ
jgi:alkylglycerol monooxygenase